MKLIDRDYHPPPVDTVDNTPVRAALWCDLVHDFMRVGFNNRFSWGYAREHCPELWVEMNAVEEELRQFLKPGVEVPMRGFSPVFASDVRRRSGSRLR